LYIGEGEKNVKAIFSLAKKLSPCVVFIDEADAIFGSRQSFSSRSSHREIINQFLKEWADMDSTAFIMVATNRPFDLDDAILRRLPRRILIDLPTPEDRLEILKIHLVAETLDDSVDLKGIADQSSLYSGSDIKNLCVSAALACVKEENAEFEKTRKYPDKRILVKRHFEKAASEISPSISDDMGSLGLIRKFDEKYGERAAGRKKMQSAWGFDVGQTLVAPKSEGRVRTD
jgi:SpoVK/Ycf46/Vps4 family AAA+-type ATPase